MTAGRAAAQAVAGTCVFAVLVAPAVVLWASADGGSLGDVSELELLTTGLVVAGATAVLAAVLMGRALDVADGDPRIGRLDPWAALLAAVTVLGVVLPLVPAVSLALLLPDEDVPIGGRAHVVAAVWVLGAAGTAGLATWLGRSMLVRGRRAARGARPPSSQSHGPSGIAS